MKMRIPSTKFGVAPIMTTSEEEFDSFHQLQVWRQHIRTLKLEIEHQESQGKRGDLELYEELESIELNRSKLLNQHPDHQTAPEVVVSRCPYCDSEIWMWVDIFTLSGQFWHLKSEILPRWSEDARCPHLFCVDGALNLNGHRPREVQFQKDPKDENENDRIRLASEIPFIKPRVLNLPTMVAVMHQIPVAEKYTGYPIVYFAERQPHEYDLCIPWARTEFVSVSSFDYDNGQMTITGKRRDIQDYELEKWVEQGKLFWLGPEDENHPVIQGPEEAFPYYHINGRQNPYTIKNGRVQNLKNPTKDSKPSIDIDYFHWTF